MASQNLKKRSASQDESFICPIDLECFTHPVILNCGHTFNKSAIEKSLTSSKCCPVCKEKDVYIVGINRVVASALNLSIKEQKTARKSASEIRSIFFKKRVQVSQKLVSYIDELLSKHAAEAKNHHFELIIDIAKALKQCKIPFNETATLENLKERNEELEWFQKFLASEFSDYQVTQITKKALFGIYGEKNYLVKFEFKL
jgi:hypothetical protein